MKTWITLLQWLLIPVMLISIAGTARAQTVFGNQSKEQSSIDIRDDIRGFQYTTGAIGGTADSITFYTSDTSKASKCAIYETDGTFVGATVEHSAGGVGAGDWVTIAISGTVNLAANTAYVLVAWSGDAMNAYVRFDPGAGTVIQHDAEAYGSWPTPATFVGEDNSSSASIYCTYTEVATGRRARVTKLLGKATP